MLIENFYQEHVKVNVLLLTVYKRFFLVTFLCFLTFIIFFWNILGQSSSLAKLNRLPYGTTCLSVECSFVTDAP